MANPFDMGNMGALLGGVQQAIESMKEKAASARHEGTAGGGLVKVTVTGDNELVAVEIKQEAMDDREMLQDLIVVATNAALRTAKEEMAKEMSALTGGLPIPPGMLPGM